LGRLSERPLIDAAFFEHDKKKTTIAEDIARTALARIIGQKSLKTPS
jgi:hypothetical protein